MTLHELESRLMRAELHPDRLQFNDGSRLVIAAAAGRVLGLFGSENSDNVFWTPSVFRVDSGGWANLGGDRTWVGPELDFYFPAHPDLSRHAPPREIDPGEYRVTGDGACRRWETTCELRSFRNQTVSSIRLRKRWQRVPGLANLPRSVRCAGYAQTVELRIDEGGSGLSLWNLLQLQFGGEFIIPIRPGAQLIRYFGDPPRSGLRRTRSSLRIKPAGRGTWKVGLLPEDTRGIAGYLIEGQRQSSILVRRFSVDPEGEYLDRPWDESGEPCGRGCALQVCSVGTPGARYAELEHHSPKPDGAESTDRSDLWAFVGPPNDIRDLATSLLDVAWDG